MTQDNNTSLEKKLPECDICGREATRRIFSEKGAWTLCERPSCLNRLQSRHPQSNLTWLKTPLDEEDESAGTPVEEPSEEA